MRGGWPRDAISWFVTLPPYLFLGAVSTVFAGLSAIVVLFLLTQWLVVPVVVGAVAAAVTWYWCGREHVDVKGEQQAFYNDRVEARLRVVGDRALVFRDFTVPYDEIGTVALLSHRSGVRIRFDLPRPTDRSSFELKLSRLAARDQFDEIVHWIETHNSDHLFVADADDKREYSREFELDEIFPGYRMVEGSADMDRFYAGARLNVDGKTYAYSFDGYSEIRVLRSSGDDMPVMAAVSGQSHRLPSVSVIAGYGLGIAHYEPVLREDTTQVELGWGPTITWHVVSGVIRHDDDILGHLRKRGEGVVLHLVAPYPEPTVLVVFLMICFFPQLVEQHAEALRHVRIAE